MSEETNAFWSQGISSESVRYNRDFVTLGTAKPDREIHSVSHALHQEKLMSEGKLKNLEQLIQLTGGEIGDDNSLYEGMNQEDQIENINCLKELGIGHVNLQMPIVCKSTGKRCWNEVNILYYSVPKNQMPEMESS